MPPNPKRRAAEPLTDEAVLQADDPRPQRVAQLPASSTGARRTLKKAEEQIPTSIFDTEADQEMQAEYGVTGAEFKPAFLYVERGPGAGQLLEVKQGTVIVGRASVSDLRLQHPSISRRHTQFKRIGEQFFVKDLGSQNGTFVNKQRIDGEVEVKPGDSIAMGNAVLRLRGPLAKGEQPGAASSPAEKAAVADQKARVSTAVVARPSGPSLPRSPSSTALKLAVFAGAVGFSLAAVLAFALVKSMTPAEKKDAAPPQVAKAVTPSAEEERERLINEALQRKMAEQDVKVVKAAPAVIAQPDIDVVVDEAPVKEQAKAPTVTKAPVAPAPTRVASAKKASAPVKTAAKEDDDEAPLAKSSGANRTSILAPYEKGNAEASLDLAKQAGDKELSDKLMRFIAAYDAANDAVAANNGSAAITNFQKALTLDEGLSSGWGKYGGEIRRQLSNLYVLLGSQYAKAGDAAKAKTSFQAALKHNPSNAQAKSGLEQLSDEQPAAPKPAPAKKSSGNSIDDAFDE